MHRIFSTVLMLLGAAAATEAQRATITGTVKYDGPPAATELRGADDARQRSDVPPALVAQVMRLLASSPADRPQDEAVYCGSLPEVEPSVNRGGVGNVVVFLEGVAAVEMNGKPIELRSANCSFQPAVQVAEIGAMLTMVNHDPMRHVVQMYRSGQHVGEFALSSVGGRWVERRRLQAPGLIDVQCRWHKWMHSSIWVFDHPYYAVTAADGVFTLPFVPPGTYKIWIWHSQLGVLTRDITVGGNQVLPLEFVYRGVATQ
jgi:hypothetical protein